MTMPFRPCTPFLWLKDRPLRKHIPDPSFDNVEVYGIIAHILGLDPASTDGNLDNIRDIFASE